LPVAPFTTLPSITPLGAAYAAADPSDEKRATETSISRRIESIALP
jgi:hypothetical protein